MATAVEPSSAPRAPGQTLGLPIASLLGAVYVLAALAVALFVVPMLWPDGGEADATDAGRAAHCCLQLAVLVGLFWFGSRIAGDAVGVRGGSTLVALVLIAIFFIARTFALNIEGGVGQMIAAGVAVGLGALAFRFFTGRTGANWMVALEEQGWFSLAQYKRSLGLRVRRLTILGILIVGGSGLYSMSSQGAVPAKWVLQVPFFDVGAVTVSNEANVLVPALLGLLAFWVAFRAANVPNFAEFLIATEAEMNKVSWSTRKRLMQDTVVVLLTTLIMTLFLLAVDLFWGWLLSRQTVGVLPARTTSPDKAGQVKEAKW
ncbi:MAG: preprotein translocase subunit SecE [Planctomycetes bacterium]|nr:preprotein translocase subunit SecE [Planctomycetota bacterium]